jgi:hypothetical protein
LLRLAIKRSFEFFTANIRNYHTRPAYAHVEFLTWCEGAGVPAIAYPELALILLTVTTKAATYGPVLGELFVYFALRPQNWIVFG